jgi:uncharacterized Zn-binding protein involved in type VI secretion
MPMGPAARILDPVVHPAPGMLTPGPGSPDVIIGNKLAWRGVPAGAAAAIQTAKQASDTTIKAAEAATVLAAGTPGAPAAKAAEETTKATAAATMGSMITGAAGGADIHNCLTPLPIPPHGPGVVIDGSPTVLINGLPACRQGDTIIEAVGPPDKILLGLFSVIIGNVPNTAAGDATGGGGPGGGSGGGGGGAAAAPNAAGGGGTASPIPANIQVVGSPDFVAKTNEALANLAKTPTGRDILSSIGASGKNVKIIEMSGANGGARPDSPSNANLKADGTPGSGSDSTVSFNPAFRPSGLPNTVVLGHELIHAEHNAYGTRDPRIDPASGVKNAELRTVGLPPFPEEGRTENSLRKDLGLPKRTSY